jgi:hypothetical protein
VQDLRRVDHAKVGRQARDEPADRAGCDADTEQAARTETPKPGPGQHDQRDLQDQHEHPHSSDRRDVAAERSHIQRKQTHGSLQEEVTEQYEDEQADEGRVSDEMARVASLGSQCNRTVSGQCCRYHARGKIQERRHRKYARKRYPAGAAAEALEKPREQDDAGEKTDSSPDADQAESVRPSVFQHREAHRYAHRNHRGRCQSQDRRADEYGRKAVKGVQEPVTRGGGDRKQGEQPGS